VKKEKYLTLKRKLIKTGTSRGIVIPVEILKLVKIDPTGKVEFKIKLK